MQRYSHSIIQEARQLRSFGKTYGEIRKSLQVNIPKSTLSEWCKNTPLPPLYAERIAKLNLDNLSKARLIGLEVNKIKREEFFKDIEKINLPIACLTDQTTTAKIALAMLCLGEASKYKSKTSRSFSLGNSDPRIIMLFLELLKRCFDFQIEKIRCTVQCRADQNTQTLEEFWMGVTKIPKRLFYKAQVDPRTKGKPTKKSDYKGVLRVDYFDTKVQLELECLADLIYNRVINKGPEV